MLLSEVDVGEGNCWGHTRTSNDLYPLEVAVPSVNTLGPESVMLIWKTKGSSQTELCQLSWKGQ